MTRISFVATALVVAFTAVRPAAAARPARDILYAQTNDPTHNQLLVIARDRSGSLRELWRVSTGGRGSGAGLGSQGSVTLSEDARWLVAVNAGSNEVSLFYVGWEGRPFLLDVAPSGGTAPVSAAIRRGLVYVVNQDGIAGLEIAWDGSLTEVEGSIRPLSAAGAGPAQISFTPGGDALIVTEKATDCVTRFPLDRDDRAQPGTCVPSAGMTPFGFAFVEREAQGAWRQFLVVSEAAGGAAGASSVSSYRVHGRDLVPVTEAAATGQSAACWIAITPDGRFAYTTNTASGNVTGFRVLADGSLVRIGDGVTGVTGGAPLDAEVSRGGRVLFVLDGANDTIVAFTIARDGTLTELTRLAGLPATTVGLTVR